MMQMAEHPTVKGFREREGGHLPPEGSRTLQATWLRKVCLEAGADDAGFVDIGRPEMADQRADILQAFPFARTLISIVLRMNRENIRTSARTVANLEFHHSGDEVNEAARRIVAALGQNGLRAANGGAMGFPMEMDRWPGKIWVISHKPVAVAAGLGCMGIHRNVIHPRFGNFILLGTVVTEAEVTEYSLPIAYSPCLECKLCVSACPTGAIGADGHFNFSACYTHNYREFMGGFSDWVENVVGSHGASDYRKRVSDPETVSIWQSLGFGPNYKAAYCLSVCPAGEEVIAPFLTDRKQYLQTVVKPLQNKVETIYVRPGSDAEQYVPRRFPHKKIKRVGNGLRPRSLDQFLNGLAYSFERGKAEGLHATYHFAFTGAEKRNVTVRIQRGTLLVEEGHAEKPDLRITADTDTWLRILAKEGNIAWALLRRKIRLRGSPRLLTAFKRCFP